MSGGFKTVVSEAEWLEAKHQLLGKPNGTKAKRKDNKVLAHSFIVIDNVIYAYEVGHYLGKGAYGKVKFVQNELGEIFVAKITYPEEGTKGMPFPEWLWKMIGLVKDVDGLNDYEIATLLDLDLAVASAKRADGCGKQVTIMKNLGMPLATYIKQHPVSAEEELVLALKTLVALYHFHTGFNSKTGQRRLNNDIKNANVLICPKTQEIRIIDFGEAFDVSYEAYNECQSFKHPRAASIEPDLVAPEIANQTGPIWNPLQRYAHASRFFSQKSDIYLLGQVLDSLAQKNEALKTIANCMRADAAEERPALPELIITLMTLSGNFDKQFSAFKLSHQSSTKPLMPGFESFMNIKEEKAKALSVLVLYGKRQGLLCLKQLGLFNNVTDLNAEQLFKEARFDAYFSLLAKLFDILQKHKADSAIAFQAKGLIQLLSQEERIADMDETYLPTLVNVYLTPSKPGYCVTWFGCEDVEKNGKEALKLALASDLQARENSLVH